MIDGTGPPWRGAEYTPALGNIPGEALVMELQHPRYGPPHEAARPSDSMRSWEAIRLALRGVGLGKVSPADPDSAYGVGRRRGEVDVNIFRAEIDRPLEIIEAAICGVVGG
jgi:hypothetical protein